MNIYFAGKMPRYVKRTVIIDNREWNLRFGEENLRPEESVQEYEDLHDWRWEIVQLPASLISPGSGSGHFPFFVKTIGGHTYTGPIYKLRNEGHGFLTLPHMDLSDSTRRHLVFETCLDSIDRSDAIFCWLDDWDCFGTIFELGYALAKNKPIFIYMPKWDSAYDNLWFARQGTAENIAETPKLAFEHFLINYAPSIIEKLAKQSVKRVESELSALRNRLSSINGGKSAAWRELVGAVNSK